MFTEMDLIIDVEIGESFGVGRKGSVRVKGVEHSISGRWCVSGVCDGVSEVHASRVRLLCSCGWRSVG